MENLITAQKPPYKLQSSFSTFIKSNPKSDLFRIKCFHHVEFWCSDATNTSSGFSYGLGMPMVAKSDLSTGNLVHASYLLRSGQLNFLFTAPYSPSITTTTTTAAIPSFDYHTHVAFVSSHGLAVRAVAVEVEDATVAFKVSVAAGARVVSPPVILDGEAIIAEVQLFGDVVLRYVSYIHANVNIACYFLPKFARLEVNDDEEIIVNGPFGIKSLDHVAGYVHELGPIVDCLKGMTGFHEMAVFAAEDTVGFTDEVGLQGVFVANNDETVIFNIVEHLGGGGGTNEKGIVISDLKNATNTVQRFLLHNEGPGVQHLALKSDDIFKTVREMKKRLLLPYGRGFEFMPSPPTEYYKDLKGFVGDVLSDGQLAECEELWIKVDRDDEGVILQTFTRPIGDRPTLILEIIQRIGCMVEGDNGDVYQKGGCGGFGKRNGLLLVKSIEDYEKALALA